jgi:hypothetical protein
MIEFEEIKKYLPQYLSDTAVAKLFSELKVFPGNIDQRMYSSFLNDSKRVYQGDGYSGLLHCELPNPRADNLNGLILSNTCDIAQENERFMASRLVHSPILKLDKYYQLLIRRFVDTGKKEQEVIDQHIEAIKKQQISNIFFLPKGARLSEDSIILYDRVSSLPSDFIPEQEITSRRIFVLSDYGFYLFIVKLAIHFTRIKEGVIRTEPNNQVDEPTGYSY